ncbi:MAG TPA: KilA-N domain-containing protein [Actinomycetota bacterium]
MTHTGGPPAADDEPFSYGGAAIRRRGVALNLIDLWRAAGCPRHRRPADWLALHESARFRSYAADSRSEPGGAAAPADADRVGIRKLEGDGFTPAFPGKRRGIWAHWQLALAYARYASPRLHRWCDTVVRAAMERPAAARAWRDQGPFFRYLEGQFRLLHERADMADRHWADLKLLVVSAEEKALAHRRDFSEGSRATIRAVVAGEPYGGQCPCCGSTPVLDAQGRPADRAQYDHLLHRGLNRPEQGWLICGGCNTWLTKGGHLARLMRQREVRAFQDAVFEHRRRRDEDPGAPAQDDGPPRR